MKKIWVILTGVASSAVVYFATLLGVLLAQWAPMLIDGSRPSTYSWFRLGISAAVAFYLVVGQEEGGDAEGKRRHLKRRIANAISHGIAWNAVLGIAGAAAGASG